MRGRCLKSNDVNLPAGDPTRCMEAHDKPKGEVKCCSILSPGDPLYNKHFTTCRAKMVGEECQYICSAQDGMEVTPTVTAAPGAAAPTQGTQPGASGGLTETNGPPGGGSRKHRRSVQRMLRAHDGRRPRSGGRERVNREEIKSGLPSGG